MIIGLLVVAVSLICVLSTILHGGKHDVDYRPRKYRPHDKQK